MNDKVTAIVELLDEMVKWVLKNTVKKEFFEKMKFAKLSFSKTLEIKNEENSGILCKDTGLIPMVVIYVYMTNGFEHDECRVRVILQHSMNPVTLTVPASVVLPIEYYYDTAFRLERESREYLTKEINRLIELHGSREESGVGQVAMHRQSQEFEF